MTKCPRCNGCGTTYRPPWIPGDQSTWSSTGAGEVYKCSLCGGSGLVPVADGQSEAAEPAEQGPGQNDPIVAESP